ncbi:hypothetical protein V6N11_001550 [Hibiscus sabdariffa]|uniref:Uncharacterized protein n=1 Tax=Hibiscus sabdariffa TaxID=183260 RepID=A0ABR2S0S2_9ROSI
MERPESETKHVLGDDGEQAMGADDLQPNATFLTDLNLLIVALSLSSVEEGLHLDETQNKDNNIKGNIPRLHPRKRETNDDARHFSYEGAPSCSCTAGLLFCLAACPTSLSWAQSKTLQLRASTDAFKLT